MPAPATDARQDAVRIASVASQLRAHLQSWFDERGRAERIESLDVEYLIYMPGTDFAALYAATLRRGDEIERALLFGNIRYDDDAAALVAKAEQRAARGKFARPRLGEPAYHLPALGMALWTYPNDPKLKTLRASLEPDAVRSALGNLGGPDGKRDAGWQVGAYDSTLVRYIPRKRVVLRYEIEWRQARGADGGPRSDPSSRLTHVYAKLFDTAEQAAQAAAVLEVLSRAAQADRRALRVPQPLYVDAEHHVVYQSALPGELLVRSADDVTPARVAEIGRGLALFQQSRLPIRATLTLDGELEKSLEAARLVSMVHPDLAPALGRLTGRLERALGGLSRLPLVPCHGTFKLAHLLSDGPRIGLVDFDSVVLADPIYDVANFVADLHYLEAGGALPAGRAERLGNAFHDAWCAQVPWGRRDTALDWYVASLLVRKQALKPVKHLHADAAPKMARILDAARRRLGA